jgi:hypothetical protein
MHSFLQDKITIIGQLRKASVDSSQPSCSRNITCCNLAVVDNAPTEPQKEEPRTYCSAVPRLGSWLSLTSCRFLVASYTLSK